MASCLVIEAAGKQSNKENRCLPPHNKPQERRGRPVDLLDFLVLVYCWMMVLGLEPCIIVNGYPDCYVYRPDWIEGGECDENPLYNTDECGWDGGVCPTSFGIAQSTNRTNIHIHRYEK